MGDSCGDIIEMLGLCGLELGVWVVGVCNSGGGDLPVVVKLTNVIPRSRCITSSMVNTCGMTSRGEFNY